MPYTKRRKGKQSTGRTTPVPPPKDEDDKESQSDEEAKTTEAPESTAEDVTKATAAEQIASPTKQKKGTSSEEADLVLTSEQRRGVYECDYCHSDISQLPRIRCAVCSDFDLCLDCFATTDHASAISRLKAAATAHSELKADGIASTMVAGISSAAANHDDTHGYRVCDSTRYPIFGLSRFVLKGGTMDSSTNGNMAKQIASATASEVTSKASDDAVESEKECEDKDEEKMLTEEENKEKDSASDGGDEKSETALSKLSGAGGMGVSTSDAMVVLEDPKIIWTAEEDLRLLDAIKTHGLGNWTDISDAVGGNGSVGKTPKRCMERYFDDYMGRYGHILPQYTIVDEGDDEGTANDAVGTESNADEMTDEDSVRASKRRHAMVRLSSNLSSTSAVNSRTRKRYKVVPTETLPGYDQIQLESYLPPVAGIQAGQEVARDLSARNELAFVKATTSAPTKKEADAIRKEWIETRMNQVGAPTVLPPRGEDTAALPGAELMGYMPRRGDFDIEWENEAEAALADMEFAQGDSEQDKQLKLQVLDIYYQKQTERENRKQFILSRNLYDYRKYVKDEGTLPQDERDLVHRMRLFERYHTPQEHKQFIADILKAKLLRKEIAKLQMYRRIGIRSLAEAEKYELDKKRLQFHKAAQLQKDAATKGTASGSAPTPEGTSPSAGAAASTGGTDAKDSLWKQYRPSDRKQRRSINRTGSDITVEGKLDDKFKAQDDSATTDKKEAAAKPTEAEGPKPSSDSTTNQGDKAEAENKDSEVATQETTKVDAVNATTTDTNEEEKETPMDIDNKEPPTEKPMEEADTAADKENAAESKNMEDPMEVEEKKPVEGFDISECRGYDLLSRREAALCVRLKIYPAQYLEIKKALIYESLMNGLLDKEGPGSGRRMVVKMDVERRGDVIDFLLRAGWISSRLAKVARVVTPTSVGEAS